MKLPYRKSYYLFRPNLLVVHVFRELKHYHQRGKRGYSDADVWSLDWYLTSWLPEALESLKEQLHGHPVSVCDPDCDHSEKHCKGKERWEGIIQEMADGFRAKRKISNEWIFDRERPEWKAWDHGMGLFHAHFGSLWD